MSGAQMLLEVGGFVALLLWGTHMVTSGILRAFGGELRHRVGNALSSQPRALMSGVGVTLALQSSTATGLMASSFAAHGVLGAVPGFILMLGANIGTALVTQVFSFPAALAAGPLFLSGFVLFRKSQTHRWKNIGRACIGIGLMFLSLHELVGAFAPIAASPVWIQLLGALAGQSFIALLVGFAAAWLCHSSVAVVLLVLSLATTGVLPLQAGLALVLGANLGGAMPPVLEAVSNVGRRIPLGNLLVRACGVLVGLALLPGVVLLLERWGHTSARVLVDAHVAFNIFLALVAWPFAKPATAFILRLLPDPPIQEDPGQPRYLDDALASQPHLALSNVERETLRLSDTVGQLLGRARSAVVKFDPGALRECSELGDAATALGQAIRRHLARLPGEAMNEQELARMHEVVNFVHNIEHASDLIPHNLVEPLAKRLQEGEVMSQEARDMLEFTFGALEEGLSLAVAALVRRDLRAARELVRNKTLFREREQAWLARPLRGPVSPGAGGRVEVDAVARALRECRRIYGHFSALAYHQLEHAGQLQDRVVAGEGS